MGSVWPLSALALVSLVTNLLMLAGPVFMLQVYDRVLASRSVPTLVALTILVAALYAVLAVLEWMRQRMTTRFAGLIDESLGAPVFRASVRQKLQPQSAEGGDPVRDLDAVRQFVGGPGPLALLDLPWVPIYLALVFVLHPALGWLAVAGALVILALLVLNEITSRRPARETNQAMTHRLSMSEDARANVEAVLAMGMLGAITARWQLRADQLRRAQRSAADRLALYTAVSRSFRFLLQSAVLAAGAWLVIMGEASGGIMIAASIITSRALAPIEQTVASWRGFVASRQALGRLRPVLAIEMRKLPQTSLPLPTRSLAATNLATAPRRDVRPIVFGVSFTLSAGDGLGVIGPSGSGKSSLARALVGVWPALGGEIRLDGSELGHYDPERLGSAIGYLPQQVELFDGTIAENIARFSFDRTDEAVLAAAAAAACHDMIAALPEGYDTRIGERGAALSAGQRQRVGLARALYGNPFLVVLDEPNSNLDADGDAALTQALQGVRARGGIVVVVAHRPSAIAAMNKVLLLQNGRQVAFGPKDEVLRQLARPAPPALVENLHGGMRFG